MERSEPSLIPEWLKSGGSLTGSGNSIHQFSLSSSHSDNHAALRHARNKFPVDIDGDIGRTSVLDRAYSAYFRRSSSSKGYFDSRSYSNFAKGNRERDWEKFTNVYHNRKNAVLSDFRNRNYSDSLDNLLPSISEKDVLMRSQSMITGKRSDTWPRKATNEFSSNDKSHHSSDNGKLGTAFRDKSAFEIDFPSHGAEERPVGYGIRRVSSPGLSNKSAFEHDFPSLGAEERQLGSEIGRVSSPGLSNPVQSLPLGTSPGTGSDGRTSALADIPVDVASNGSGVAVTSQNVCAGSTPTTTMGLNMAEAVAHGPFCARTPPLLNVETQRLEELAIKQSRQLIPLATKTARKTLVVSPEKLKPNVGQQLRPSVSVNSTRGGTSRSDGIKVSNESRLCILKPSRELNGVFLVTTKDNLSPTNGSNKLVNIPLSITPSAAAAAPFRSSGNSPKSATAEHNQTQFWLTMEKRTTAQAQSRNDFFNHLKKKSTTDSASSVLDPGPTVLPPVPEKPDELSTEDSSSSVTLKDVGVLAPEISISDLLIDNRSEVALNGYSYTEPQHCSSNGEGHSRLDVFLYPDEEEEAAFLRSLGWEENAGDDDGLTEEEINTFLEQYSKLKPSSKLFQRIQSLSPLNSHNGTHGDTSSGSSSMDSYGEASTRPSSY